MVRPRRGASQLGCLFMLLVLAAIGYFGFDVGEIYWNFYQYQDRMKQEARFAAQRSDAVIRRRIAMFADSLGLPGDAKNVRIRRGTREIYIWAEYTEHVEVPGFKRDVHLNPQAAGKF
jgi:hypothetical protein